MQFDNHMEDRIDLLLESDNEASRQARDYLPESVRKHCAAVIPIEGGYRILCVDRFGKLLWPPVKLSAEQWLTDIMTARIAL